MEVKNIMTKKVVSVRPDMSITEANEIISKRKFNGVPVVDNDNKLVGLLTEYDLLEKGSFVHLPTFQKVLSGIKLYKDRNSELQKEIAELNKISVKDVMNRNPIVFRESDKVQKAIKTFQNHHRVNPIPVVNHEREVVGVVSRYDVLKILAKLRRA